MARKLAWSCLFVLLAIGTGVALSIKPWEAYRVQKKKADQAQAEMRSAEQEKAELVRQKARFESPIGKEELARERGYRKPNEQPVDVR